MCLAIPGELLEVRGEELSRLGRVSFGGVVREVSLACLPEAEPGQYVLVHAGMALGVIDPEEAARVFTWLTELGGDELGPHEGLGGDELGPQGGLGADEPGPQGAGR